MKVSFSCFYIFCLLIVLLVFPGNSVSAFDSPTPSPATDIGVAFYKLVGSEPDLRRWVIESDLYKEAPSGIKNRLMIDETNRLRRRFKDYNLAKEQLIIGIEGKIIIEPKKADEKHPYRLKILLGEDIDYFPYEIAGQWIAVIVRDIKKNLVHDITQVEYDRMTMNLGKALPLKSQRKVKVIMQVKPVKVDAERPVTVNDHDLWLMLAEPATISLWRGQSFLWESRSSWYQSPTEVEIRMLFRE